MTDFFRGFKMYFMGRCFMKSDGCACRYFVLPFGLLLGLVLGGCGPGQAETAEPPANVPATLPSSSPSNTTFITFTPQLTPSPSQTPTGINPNLGPVPQGALARLGKGRANAVAFSPDGQDLSVASNYGVFVYHADTLAPIWSAPMDGWTETLRYSPDGTRLASGIGRDQVHIWNSLTGEELASWMIPPGNSQWESQTLCGIAFSPDGTLLAGLDFANLYLWKSTDGRLKRTVAVGGSNPCDLAFSPDGKKLAVAVGVKAIVLNTATGQALRELTTLENRQDVPPEEDMFYDIEYSPDGKWLVTNDGNIWDSQSGKIIRELKDFNSVVVELSPDGRLAAGNFGVWQIDTGELLWPYPPEYMDGMPGLSFSPDGGILAVSSNNGVVFLDTANGQIRKMLEGHFPAGGVGFSADGGSLISWDEGQRYRVWDAESLWLTGSFSGEFCGNGCERITAADVDIPLSAPVNDREAISSDGRLILLLKEYSELRYASGDRQLLAWLPTGSGAAFSPDGRLLAIVDRDNANGGSILLWDVAALENGAMPPPEFPTPTPTATTTPTLAAPPDGTSYVSPSAPSGCALAPGLVVRAGENANLWSMPDVTQGIIVGQPAVGQLLLVIGGPVKGYTRSNKANEGWFWEMSTNAGGESSGWLWQFRIQECVA
jgi:WD40 repeat protein